MPGPSSVMVMVAGALTVTVMRPRLPGLSQKQLTHTLRHLERDGYLLRTAYATIPPRVEYSLTELGHQLVTRLFLVGKFALDHRQKIETARQRYDAATAEREAMSQAS